MPEPQPRRACTRCGRCCASSTPSLQLQDFRLVNNGMIPRSALYTVRVGELVWDNINQRNIPTNQELIKIKEKEQGTECVFHIPYPSRCTIYPQRPAQCRALKCWDTTEFEEVFIGPKLNRWELISDPLLHGLVREHERRCSYKQLSRLVKEIPEAGEKAVEEIIEVLRFDTGIRPFVASKLGILAEEIDLFFGRPLRTTIAMFGLQVIKEPDGSFFLTVRK